MISLCFRFQREVSGKSWVAVKLAECYINHLCTFKTSLRVTKQLPVSKWWPHYWLNTEWRSDSHFSVLGGAVPLLLCQTVRCSLLHYDLREKKRKTRWCIWHYYPITAWVTWKNIPLQIMKCRFFCTHHIVSKSYKYWKIVFV